MTQTNPSEKWLKESRQLRDHPQWQIRFAALVGHMRVDRVALRRASLIDFLSDGRPHPAEEIHQQLAKQLGEDCWGKRPFDTLARDIRTLRKGKLRIAYSRRPEVKGYYLQYPPIERPSKFQEPISWRYIDQVRQLSSAEKLAQAFASAEFALTQKRLILKEQHPEWTDKQVDTKARTLVYGVTI